jgi:hypothetical protein
MRLEKSLQQIFVSLSAMIVVACGGSSNKTNLPPSGLKKRVLLSNPLGNAQFVNTISIGNGFHRIMRFTGNNHLYIGSVACSLFKNTSTGMIRGCLSILDTGAGALQFPEFSPLRTNFDVTAIQPISGRTAVYVCEGGELDIFDSTTGALTPNQVDVVGKATDVMLIDP